MVSALWEVAAALSEMFYLPSMRGPIDAGPSKKVATRILG